MTKLLRSLKQDLAAGLGAWDWYRGNINIYWNLVTTPRGRQFEVFATMCRCGASWGWTADLAQIIRIRDKMRRKGCPKCRRKRGD